MRGTSGFDTRAVRLLQGSFEDAGLPFGKVDRYSVTTSNSALAGPVEELKKQLKGKYKLVVAIGAEATKRLTGHKRVLDDVAGALTWNADLGAWVLPSYHPSVVYVGDKKTLNSRYDQFDILFDHIHRAVAMVNGTRDFPSINHDDDLPPMHFVGHNGVRLEDSTWTGYYECTDSEAAEAQAYFANWVDILDRRRSNDEAYAPFAIDTESCNLNIFRPNGFLMFQVFDGTNAYAFNAGVVLDPRVKPFITSFLLHAQARWRLWNTKYDRQVIWHNFGVDLEDRDICGLALSMGVTEKGKQCGLKYRSRQDLNAPFYEEALDEWFVYPPDIKPSEKKRHKNYSHIRPDVMALYGNKDTYYTYEEVPLLIKRVAEEGTLESVKNLLLPAQRVLADVEYQGMKVDVEYARTTSADWEPLIADAIRKVQDYARDVGFPLADSGIGAEYKTVCECVPVRARFHLEGARVLSYAKRLRGAEIELPSCERCKNKRYVSRLDVTLNVNSPKQMQHLCYDILGMKELPHEDLTTNKFFWEFNANHPLAKLVAEYKELQYLRRNFLEGIQRFVAEDGKVHPDFLLFGTKTGRLAIHSPAAQTIPQHSENAKAIKRLFVQDDDETLIVNVDYKSLEMFMAHHLTGDPKLLENLTGEWDIHTALAAVVYNKDAARVTPEERQSVKSVNFGAGYGISGFKLSLDPAMEAATGGDPEVAQEFINAFWSLYSVWASKCDEWRAQAHDVQFLTTELGRKRRWNLITKDNLNKVNNQAINFPGQSMASDLCLSSLIRLHPALQARGWGRVLLTVHDSLVFSIKKSHLHEAVRLIEHEMTTPPFETTTPFAVDIEVGLNYGDKEPYDPERDYDLSAV